jgi:hypothetical protein
MADGSVQYLSYGKSKPKCNPYRGIERAIKYKLPTGQIIELHTSNALTMALDKSYQSVWRMIKRGEIPKTPFKHSTSGDRLYSKDQISLIKRCMEESNLRNGISVKSTGFVERVHREHDQLLISYGLKNSSTFL